MAIVIQNCTCLQKNSNMLQKENFHFLHIHYHQISVFCTCYGSRATVVILEEGKREEEKLSLHT